MAFSPTLHTQLIGDNTATSGVKWQLEVCSLIIVNPPEFAVTLRQTKVYRYIR